MQLPPVNARFCSKVACWFLCCGRRRLRRKLHAASGRLPRVEDESVGQTSRGAPFFLITVSDAREGPRVCQVHIYQQAGLEEIDNDSIKKLK